MPTSEGSDFLPDQDVIYTGPIIDPSLHGRDLLKANIQPGALMAIDSVREGIALITYGKSRQGGSSQRFEVPLITLTSEQPAVGDFARYTGEGIHERKPMADDPEGNPINHTVLRSGCSTEVIAIDGDNATVVAIGRFSDPERPQYQVSLATLLKMPNTEA